MMTLISQTVMLCMEGGRVNHCCCMGVVCHDYGELGVDMVGGGWQACRTKPWEVGRITVLVPLSW